MRRHATNHSNPHRRAKKWLGQNFLIDKNIIKKIINTCALCSSDTVLEIGPGRGALTHAIAPLVKNVIAVETDRALAAQLADDLRNHSSVRIVRKDILAFDFTTLPRRVKVIGNLPYNISSPIIQKIITNRTRVDGIFITVQQEFGKRMIAQRNTRDYSALTLFVRYYADARILFKINNSCFRPMPKVLSCFMRLDIHRRLPCRAQDEALLWRLVRCAFQQRRKTIFNALAPLIDKEALAPILRSLAIAPQRRPETLTLHEFVRLSNAIARLTAKKPNA